MVKFFIQHSILIGIQQNFNAKWALYSIIRIENLPQIEMVFKQIDAVLQRRKIQRNLANPKD